MGIDARTGHYMIYSDDAVKLARTVVRVPSLEKWDKSLMSDVELTPYNMHTPKDTEVVFRERVEGPDDVPADRDSTTKRLYLRPSDFIGPDGFGLTRVAGSAMAS